MERGKQGFTKSYTRKSSKEEGSNSHQSKFEKGGLWKAKQLKDYRRANGLCYKCGEKYAPGHPCNLAATAQVKEANEIISDEMLDTLVTHEVGEAADCHVTLNALTGSTQPGTIQFKALVGNQVMLLLLDSGSSHSFVDKSLVDKLQCQTTPISTLKVKVASGDFMYCDTMVQNMQWWL